LATPWDQITEFTVHRGAFRRPYFEKPGSQCQKRRDDRVMVKKTCRYNKATKLFWNGKLRKHNFGNAVPLIAPGSQPEKVDLEKRKGSLRVMGKHPA
jgi:hypothetical protein